MGAVTLTVASAAGAGGDGEASTRADALQIVLGAGLIVLAYLQWRSRPGPGAEPELPRWMSAVDGFSTLHAAGAGVVISAVNPKNLVLTIAAATTIAAAGLPAGEQAGAYVVYGLIATLGVAAPIGVFFALGDRSASVLDGLKTWPAYNHTTVMAVLFLVIGAEVLGQGIAG